MNEHERDITLSVKGEELADTPEMAELIEDIEHADENYPWVLVPRYHSFTGPEDIRGYVDDFTSSEVFQTLSEAEQAEARSSIDGVLVDEPEGFWTIEVPAEEQPRRIAVMAADALLLCGITLDDIARVSPESVDRYGELGFQRRLDMANFIGACMISRAEMFKGSFVEFSLGSQYGVERVIGLGGSEHGDFRIRQSDRYIDGSIDPAGNRVMYAPKGPEIYLGAYHSVEPIILESVVKHIDRIGLPEEEQKQILRSVMDKYLEGDDGLRGGGNFADFGDSDAYLQAYEIEHWYSDPLDRKQHETGDWCRIPYNAGSKYALSIKTEGKDFVLQNGETGEGYEWLPDDKYRIAISPDLIPDFLSALLQQAKRGAGRTSDRALLNILNARLSVDWHS